MGGKKSIKISEDVYAKLLEYCKESGMKMYKVVDEAILQYIETKQDLLQILKSINEKLDRIISKLNTK